MKDSSVIILCLMLAITFSQCARSEDGAKTQPPSRKPPATVTHVETTPWGLFKQERGSFATNNMVEGLIVEKDILFGCLLTNEIIETPDHMIQHVGILKIPMFENQNYHRLLAIQRNPPERDPFHSTEPLIDQPLLCVMDLLTFTTPTQNTKNYRFRFLDTLPVTIYDYARWADDRESFYFLKPAFMEGVSYLHSGALTEWKILETPILTVFSSHKKNQDYRGQFLHLPFLGPLWAAWRDPKDPQSHQTILPRLQVWNWKNIPAEIR